MKDERTSRYARILGDMLRKETVSSIMVSWGRSQWLIIDIYPALSDN